MTNIKPDQTQMPSAVFFHLPNGGYMRPNETDDGAYLYRWVNDPNLRPYLNRTEIEMFEEEIDWIKGLPKRKQTNMVWMICTPEHERVGTMWLHGISWKDGTATTGAMFGNTAKQNQGFGQMAKMKLLDHVFNVLNLRQIYSNVISVDCLVRSQRRRMITTTRTLDMLYFPNYEPSTSTRHLENRSECLFDRGAGEWEDLCYQPVHIVVRSSWTACGSDCLDWNSSDAYWWYDYPFLEWGRGTRYS